MKHNDEGESQAIRGVDSSRDIYGFSLPGEILRYDSKEEDSESELENDCGNNVKRHEPHDELGRWSANDQLYHTVCM